MERVMVLDSGGRGSALVDKYLQSQYVDQVLAVPGNDWLKVRFKDRVKTFPKIASSDAKSIVEICKEYKVALVDVAQDNAVEAGVADHLQNEGINALGPTKDAGRIEWDKAWSRKFGEKYDIPQPDFVIFHSIQQGLNYIKNLKTDSPKYVKASGLASGKGALSAKNNKEVISRICQMRGFGEAGRTYLIEEWLKGDFGENGEEFSSFILSDGERFRMLGNAQDHKRVFDGDRGDQTGGMGCSSPPLVLKNGILEEIKYQIFKKAIEGMKDKGTPYKGILYLGGILVVRNGRLRPFVIEFNARWGDPEAQVLLQGIKNDIFEVGMMASRGDITDLKLETDSKARIVLAGVPKGYPNDYSFAVGKRISGIEEIYKMDNIKFLGGGMVEEEGKFYVGQNRQFYIVSEGKDTIEARERAMEAMSKISIEGDNLHYRKDIGIRDVNRILQERKNIMTHR